MGRIFKSKAEKAQERKMKVKQSMREMEKRIAKLEETKTVYIQAAREAAASGLQEQLDRAKNALRMTDSEIKRTKQMLLDARIISQMKDMTEMTTQFLQAVKVISEDIARGTKMDVSQVNAELQIAMDRVSDQTDQLEDMLKDSQDNAKTYSNETATISDAELDRMIFGTSELDTPAMEEKLAELKNEIGQ